MSELQCEGVCGVNKDVKEARVSAVQRKLSLWKTAFQDTVALVAGRRSDCIWLVHVIFPHVQMTCQLPLNYMRHLDQSAQCQRWLILFIVAAMTVPVETEHHKKHRARHYGRDLEKAAGDRIARARVDSRFLQLMIRYAAKNKWWKPFPESGNGLRQDNIWTGKKKKKLMLPTHEEKPTLLLSTICDLLTQTFMLMDVCQVIWISCPVKITILHTSEPITFCHLHIRISLSLPI